jgi:hypothetical protein
MVAGIRHAVCHQRWLEAFGPKDWSTLRRLSGGQSRVPVTKVLHRHRGPRVSAQLSWAAGWPSTPSKTRPCTNRSHPADELAQARQTRISRLSRERQCWRSCPFAVAEYAREKQRDEKANPATLTVALHPRAAPRGAQTVTLHERDRCECDCREYYEKREHDDQKRHRIRLREPAVATAAQRLRL